MPRDLRQAVRYLASHKAYAVVAAVTVALGVGVNAALFSLTDAVRDD